jgi:hypothetical protein
MKIAQSILIMLLVAVTISSCKKYNQIDNGSTVKTPYTLFIGGYNGIMKKTNDALYFSSLFATDNSTIRSIIVADSNVCMIKDSFYYSKDDGKFFQLSYKKVTPHIDRFYKYYIPNISLYNQNDKRLYLCSKNSFIEFSTDLGKTFQVDNNWIDASKTLQPTSITQLNNGRMFMMKDTSLFRQIGVGGWEKMEVDTPFNLTYTANWYISHTHDTLMAIDFDGTQGVYYSTDEGRKWYIVKQLLPNTKKILFGKEVFGQFYIGLDSAGLYSFSGNQLKPVGKGIPWYAKVSDMVGKTIRYRTDATRNYWFCATDQGLYISETDGTDWKLVHPGQWSTLR